MSGSKCYKCNRMGHFARECPMGSGPGPRGRGGPREKCYKCNRPGHFARDCKEEEDHCYRCDGVGHIAKDCEHSSDEPSCYNCSKMGHIARDCPEPERTCYVCNKSGHISRQCTENKSENRNAKVCYVCGKIGHISRECPMGGEQENEKRCYVCGASGHISRDCPQGESDTTCYRGPMPFGNPAMNPANMNPLTLQSEMEELKRQLSYVHQKYENEKQHRELLEQQVSGGQGNGFSAAMGNSAIRTSKILMTLDDDLSRLQTNRYRIDPLPPLTLTPQSTYSTNGSTIQGQYTQPQYTQGQYTQPQYTTGQYNPAQYTTQAQYTATQYTPAQYTTGMKRESTANAGSWDFKRQRY